MNHSVYTRCKYGTDEQVAARLELSKRFTIPAMVAQRDCVQPKWVWLCHPRHQEMIERALREAGWTGAIGFNEMRVTTYKETQFIARLGILAKTGDEQMQTALDSDDWVHPEWVRGIQQHWRAGKKPFVVYWHPLRYRVSDGKWFRPRRLAKWCSMFYTVYNPTNQYHIYMASHNQLQTIKGLLVYPDAREGYTALVVHGDNLHTTIKPSDVEIRTPPAFIDKPGTEV